jgi:STE24 endopeptidase
MTLDRRTAWVTAAGAALVFVVLAAVSVPWDWVPGGELRPAEARDVFTAEQIVRAEEYASLRRYLGWASYGVSLLVAAALGFTPVGARLVRRVRGCLLWWAAAPLAVLLVMLAGRLATLPFSVLIRRRNLDYGLTEQGWPAWAVDVLKSVGVGWVMTSLVVLLVLLAVRRSPRRWFLWAGGGAAVVTMLGSFLYPVLLAPVFNDFEALPEGSLRTSVLVLAEEQGVDVSDVLVADASRRTTTLNAYVSGFGRTRRVVLYDNLVEALPDAEARVIVAHELAHAEHDDVLLGTSLGAVGAVLGVALLALVLDSARARRRAGITAGGDAAAVPLLLALWAVGAFLVSPVENTISRAIEVRADRESLAATGESDTFVNMQRELALASLSDPTPPVWNHIWFGSHPTVLQRAGLPASLAAAGDRP